MKLYETMEEHLEYVIGAAQGGMGRIRNPDAEDLMALNNTTGEWKRVSEILE